MGQKTLVSLYSAQLHETEKVQLIVRLVSEIESSKIRLTDEEVKKLLARLKEKLTTYQGIQEPVRRSQYTEKLKEADEMRDVDMAALFAGVRVYRSSKRANEQEAYKSLYALMKAHQGVTNHNYEEETAIIARLLTQLKSDKYRADVNTLNLTALVTRLTESQTQFETLFTAKVKSELVKATVNQKKMRDDLFEEYQRFCQYMDAIAWARNTEVYHKLLAIVNNGRKYFAEVIHKRNGRSKKESKTKKKVSENTSELLTQDLPTTDTPEVVTQPVPRAEDGTTESVVTESEVIETESE